MTGDLRNSGFEHDARNRFSDETWFEKCGHLPERMDPVFRLLWWKKHRPEVVRKAKYFLGWHEFFTLRLTGRAVTDRSLAGKWLAYDLSSDSWSSDTLANYDIDLELLPEIQPWGTVVEQIRPGLSETLGLPKDAKVAIGCFDASGSALGTGASTLGTGCLLSGTWEDLIVPVSSPPPAAKLATAGFSIGPHPGPAGLAVFALTPNGTSVLEWARHLLGMSLGELDGKLMKSGPAPSPVLAVPHLSGATAPWKNGNRSRGAVLGMTLATSSIDLLKALMEGIAYDLSYIVRLLKEIGVNFSTLRAAGGGIRSDWWTQLKADLTRTKIETVNQAETGTLAAAILAGLAVGEFNSIDEELSKWVRVDRRFTPDEKRIDLYDERIKSYATVLNELLKIDWAANLHPSQFS